MVPPGGSTRLATLVLTSAILAVSAGPAAGSTAEVVELVVPLRCDVQPTQCMPPPPRETALLYLGAGEANRVTLRPGPGQVRISDPGGRIAAGQGCRRRDDHNVDCALPRALVYVAMGGGSDSLRSDLAPATRLTVDGGAGNDALAGGPGPDALLGGSGSDRLLGGGGGDRLFDASSRSPLSAGQLAPMAGGSDVLFGGSASPGRGRDSFDGGSGNDTLSYEGRRDRLRIDLAGRRRLSGARGERDAIRRVENAVGGAGGDRMRGNAQANRLLGGGEATGALRGGSDRIAGGGGADVLAGGAGRNVLSGGGGNDTVTLGVSGRGERVFCGSGSDVVDSPTPADFLNGDCEAPRLTGLIDGVLGPPRLRSHLPLRRGRPATVLSGALSCFLDNACQATVELRVRGPGTRRGSAPRRGTLLGSLSLGVRVRETKPFELGLSPTGLRRVRRHRALRVRVIVTTPRSSTEPPGYVTLVRAPR